MAKALAALALQMAFRGDVRVYGDLQTAEFSQGKQFHHFWSPR
jgi:hypothetical protein